MATNEIEDNFNTINDLIDALMARPANQLHSHLGATIEVLLRFYGLVEKSLDPLPHPDFNSDDHKPPRLLS